MSDTNQTFNSGGIADVIELATRAALASGEQVSRDSQDLQVFVLDDENDSNGRKQTVEVVDLSAYGARPISRTGTYKVFDYQSFTALVNRYKQLPSTTLWANRETLSVTAVLDDHDALQVVDAVVSPQPSWGRHRAHLGLRQTEDWKYWLSKNGTLMSQPEFASFIEQGALCIERPDPATFYEIAMSLRATTGVDFKSSYVMESGEIGFRYEETTAASAGKKGELEIPRTFELALQPFEGSDVYPLQARLLYRTGQTGLQLGYTLIRPQEIVRMAFQDVCDLIGANTELPVFAGSPRAEQ